MPAVKRRVRCCRCEVRSVDDKWWMYVSRRARYTSLYRFRLSDQQRSRFAPPGAINPPVHPRQAIEWIQFRSLRLRRRWRSLQLLEFAPLGLLGLWEPGQFRCEKPTGRLNLLALAVVTPASPRQIAPSRRGAGCRHSRLPPDPPMDLPEQSLQVMSLRGDQNLFGQKPKDCAGICTPSPPT